MAHLKRHRVRRRKSQSGVAVPAFLCLLFAAMLLLGNHVGGDDLARKLLGTLAQNEHFIFGAFALETGQYPDDRRIHTPHASANGREEAPTDEDLAETAEIVAMENAGLAPPAEIPAQNLGSADVQINNQSGLDVNVTALLAQPVHFSVGDAGSDQPQVLVYHTHGTEAYTQANGDSYKPSGDARTTDSNYNVVRVGAELCKTLEARGIKTVHLTDLHDYPAYNGSYGRSLAAVQAALKKYPSVKMAIDVHRDAILAADGTKRKVLSTQNGQDAAQLMLVMGTNAMGLSFDNWRTPLQKAVALQSALNAEYPTLMRPINLRKQRFNLHLTPGSMLLEVGSSGNTLREAIAGIQLFGDTLATELGAPQTLPLRSG